MELDNLKKSWQEAEVQTPLIDEAKIQHIINNKGQSAYSKLVKYERMMIFLALALIPLSFVFRETLVISIYMGTVFATLLWQFYKYRFLKKIDISNMNILEISEKINTYKKYLVRELVVATVWAVLFCGLWVTRVVYRDLLNTSLDSSIVAIILIVVYLLIVLSSVGFGFLVYKTYAVANVKKIEESIEEIKEFKEEQ